MTDEDEASRRDHLIDYNVFKERVANKFEMLSIQLKYLMWVALLQLLTVILLLGGDKGLALLRALKVM